MSVRVCDVRRRLSCFSDGVGMVLIEALYHGDFQLGMLSYYI